MSRWILAFDAGCQSCISISDRVRDAVAEDWLEVRDLAEPEMLELRRRALGDNPPWLPTLIAVDDETQIRAWTGAALSMRLARLLGPARSLRVVRALAQEKTPENANRRRFLKVVPGVAVGGILLSGGAASATTGPSGSAGQDVKRVTGAKATATLDKVSGDAAVVALGRRLGIDPGEAVANGVVEQLPAPVNGVAGQLYVSVLWADDSHRTVRTSHFVSTNGHITSNIFMLIKTGAEPTMTYGELGGKTVTLTESQAASTQSDAIHELDSFTDCLADCLGISSALVTAVLAGCGLACVITAGTACIVCAAGAFGFSVGTVTGCFAGCA
jgi:hypothetical protein